MLIYLTYIPLIGALVLDSQKREFLRLSLDNPEDEIELSKNGRYFLCWEFQDATGNCELRW